MDVNGWCCRVIFVFIFCNGDWDVYIFWRQERETWYFSFSFLVVQAVVADVFEFSLCVREELATAKERKWSRAAEEMHRGRGGLRETRKYLLCVSFYKLNMFKIFKTELCFFEGGRVELMGGLKLASLRYLKI